MASDKPRPVSLATLSTLESTWDPLPIDAAVAREFAVIVAGLRARRRRAPVLYVLIGATAVAEGIPVVTQDRDLEAIAGVEVIRV
jgi:predicted nucleic acid-binding protein